ncbi:MAG: MFS transporter [Ruminococcaceae bacterium]|nr:MFS transporter [Oscillospiraceae bacterium]
MPRLKEKNSASIWSVPFVLLMIINFFDTLCFQMLRTMMTQYAMDIGIATAQATALASVLSIASLVMRPVAGRLVDTINNKLIMTLSYVGMVITMILYFLAKSYPLLMFVRLLNGAFYGISAVVTMTIAGSMLPEEKMGQGISMFGMGLAVAITFSSMIGAWLYSFGAGVLFAASLASMIIALTLSMFVPNVKRKMSTEKKSVGQILRGLVAVEAIPVAVLNLIFNLAYSASAVFLVVYFNAKTGEGNPIGTIGVFFMVWGLMLFVARPVGGKLFDRYGLVPAELLFLVCLGLYLFLISISTGWVMSLIAALIGSFGFGGSVPVLQAAAFVSAPPERKGAANSTNLMGGDLGSAIGGVLFGQIATWFVREGQASFSYQVCLRVGACMCALALVYLFILGRNPKYRRKKAE